MDAYEATRIVLSRIQNLDPENAAKIMGLLLIQDHGEKEMIRLAFGPEALLHSVVIKVRKDLCLLPSSSPATPSGAGVAVFSRQNSARFLPVSPSSWSAAPTFSRTSAVPGDRSPTEDYPPTVSPPSYGGGDLIDDLQLHDQLSFLNEGANVRTKNGEFFYSDIIGDLCSPSAAGEGMLLSNSMGWGPNGTTHRRTTAAAITDLSLNSDLSCAGFGWRPCLYFARGFCKNGNACRFLHDDAAADQELLLRSKSSKLMASAASFPYSPTSTIPPFPSYSAKYMNFLLQQQHDGHRAAAAALMLNEGGSDDQMHNFMGRTRSEFAGISNPGSRQIYLTFPADSTFREEDVSNYFSIYGPVQDVRIPYQQKRMFGFVTFLYPETVKLILAKGNPHFVCDARVLVKPYKEKGKVPDKKQQQQHADHQQLDFSSCWNSAALDSPVDLGGRMFYGGGAQDASLLHRRLEEQQQAELLQQVIELQGRRFQLMDLNLKPRSFSTAVSATTLPATVSPAKSADERDNSAELQLRVNNNEESPEELSPKEDYDFPVCTDHNLPDSPFASPTNATDRSFSTTSNEGGAGAGNHLPFSPLSSCFFQIPARFSPGHGAVGM